MTVAVVVLHYEAPDVALETARQISAVVSDGPRFLVDNGSAGLPLDSGALRALGFEVVSMGSNGGYSAGMNSGIGLARATNAEHVLLLTQEVRLNRDAVESMVATIQSDTTIGVVGPLLGEAENKSEVFSAGGVSGSRWRRLSHLRTPLAVTHWLGSGSVDADWLDGSVLLLRLAAAESVGGFDERFFLYCEDVDICWRLRAAGWRVVQDRDSLAFQSPGVGRERLRTSSLLLLAWLHGGLFRASAVLAATMRTAIRDVVKERAVGSAFRTVCGAADGVRLLCRSRNRVRR